MIRNYNELITLIDRCNKLSSTVSSNAKGGVRFIAKTNNPAEDMTLCCIATDSALEKIRSQLESINESGYTKCFGHTQSSLELMVGALESLAEISSKELGIQHNYSGGIYKALKALAKETQDCTEKLSRAVRSLQDL